MKVILIEDVKTLGKKGEIQSMSTMVSAQFLFCRRSLVLKQQQRISMI